MGLLEQYQQQNPEAFRENKTSPITTDAYGREYSTLVTFVIRFSGGVIRDAKQANYVLLGIATVIAAISLILFLSLLGFSGSGASRAPVAAPDNSVVR